MEGHCSRAVAPSQLHGIAGTEYESGGGRMFAPECRCYDFDEDEDIDLRDFAEFQRALAG